MGSVTNQPFSNCAGLSSMRCNTCVRAQGWFGCCFKQSLPGEESEEQRLRLTSLSASQDIDSHVAWSCLNELLHAQDVVHNYSISMYASYNAKGTEVERPVPPSANQVLQNKFLSWTSDATITLSRAKNLFAALDQDIRKLENRPPEAISTPLAGRFIGSYGIWQLDRALRLYYESNTKDLALNRLEGIKAEVDRLEKRRERLYSTGVRSLLEAELNRLTTVALPKRDRLRWDEIADQQTREIAKKTGYEVRSIVAEFASRAGLGVDTHTGLPDNHQPGQPLVEFGGRFKRSEIIDCRPGVFDDAGTWTYVNMTGTRCYVTVRTYTKFTTFHEITEQVGRSVPWSKVVQHEWDDIIPYELTEDIVNWCKTMVDGHESADAVWHTVRNGAARGTTAFGPTNASVWSDWLSTLPIEVSQALAKVMSFTLLVSSVINSPTPDAFRDSVVRRLLGHCDIAYSPSLAMPKFVPAALCSYIRPGDGATTEPELLDDLVGNKGDAEVFAELFEKLSARKMSTEGDTAGATSTRA